MSLLRQILSGSPDRVFLSVKNASATTMTLGRGVVFDYYNTTQCDGYNVTWRTTSHHAGLLAGIVVHHAIQPSSYGLVQAFGHVDNMAVAYTAQAQSTNPLTGINNMTSLSTIFLSIQTQATVPGAFEPVTYPTATTINMSALSFHLANAAVYLGTTCAATEATNTHTSQHTSYSVKGFIRAL